MKNENLGVKDPNAYRTDRGPFDIIGDVHGCLLELEALIEKLGYDITTLNHPHGRKLVFVGDFIDRGPDVPGVLKHVLKAVQIGRGYAVIGNHDDKYRRYLGGSGIQISKGLQATLDQMDLESEAFRRDVHGFLESLTAHLVLADGELVIAHAGLPEKWHGKEETGPLRSFALYGEVRGERDANGYPVRGDWARTYKGRATVVHGHVAEPEVREKNSVFAIDTGCVYGGRLTALRWPEREITQIDALDEWYPSRGWVRPKSPV